MINIIERIELVEANILHRFLSNQNRISKEHPDFRRAYLINAILSMMILFFLFFTIIDIVAFKLYQASLINCTAFLTSSFILYYFHKTDKVRFIAKVTVAILALSILLVILQLSPKHDIFYWMVTLPPVAFFLLGRKFGYVVSIIFGGIIATYYFFKYEHWDSELFGLEAASNISLAYLGLVMSIGFFESSRQEAFNDMQKDIERRKLAEQTLKENEVRLSELNATKDKFFSIIAHDLRNPFNTIMGFSEILEDQIKSKDYGNIEKFAILIKDSSDQVMDLLTNLLEWSRLQTGKIQLRPEYFDIGIIVNQIVNLFKDTASQKMITISTENSNNGNLFADKDMIDTVIRNLISNAIKFTPSGGTITILTKQTQADQIVVVKDNGIGIKQEVIDKLFRIDENHSTLGTQNEKGTGLGLLLCKEFIEKHGGKIWVESEVGKGSTFSFSIPMELS